MQFGLVHHFFPDGTVFVREHRQKLYSPRLGRKNQPANEADRLHQVKPIVFEPPQETHHEPIAKPACCRLATSKSKANELKSSFSE
jgi:hypothetical protein